MPRDTQDHPDSRLTLAVGTTINPSGDAGVGCGNGEQNTDPEPRPPDPFSTVAN